MIQDDDSIVMRDTTEDAQFEADLNQELEKAVLYNKGRELSWTFPITLITLGEQRHIHTLTFNPKDSKQDLVEDFKKCMRKLVSEFKLMVENNKKIIDNIRTSQDTSDTVENSSLDTLFIDIIAGSHK